MTIGETLLALGAEQVEPGIYTLSGEMHIDAEELLVAKGFAPTPANITRLERAAAQVGDDLAIAAVGIEWGGRWRNA
jgi:hypothetical protein